MKSLKKLSVFRNIPTYAKILCISIALLIFFNIISLKLYTETLQRLSYVESELKDSAKHVLQRLSNNLKDLSTQLQICRYQGYIDEFTLREVNDSVELTRIAVSMIKQLSTISGNDELKELIHSLKRLEMFLTFLYMNLSKDRYLERIDIDIISLTLKSASNTLMDISRDLDYINTTAIKDLELKLTEFVR